MKLRSIVVFVFALLLFAFAEASTAQDCSPRPRLISVSGTAEIDAAPDQVNLSLGIESHDKDLIVAKSQHDGRVKKVIALAHSAGVNPKDIETSALRMAPNYSEEKVPRFLGYEVSQTMEITLKDLSKYEELMTKLLSGGVNRVDNIAFYVGDTRKLKDEARLKAIRAAKEKAVAMATELGQTIGKPWDISEETGWGALQATANSFGSNAPRVVEEEATIAPGQVTIRASVRVSFQLE